MKMTWDIIRAQVRNYARPRTPLRDLAPARA